LSGAAERHSDARARVREVSRMTTDVTQSTGTSTAPVKTLPLLSLTAMVVGSMVGAGVFSLPRNFAQATGVWGALIAWGIAGTGMMMLALVFQRLSRVRPDLDAGIFAYAKAGFGDYIGFFSAFGYWASACVGNVTYWVLIGSTLGGVFPALGEGNTLLSVTLSSIGVWVFHLIVSRGVQSAAFINTIVTIAKLIPIVLFLFVVAIVGFNWDTFVYNLWGDDAATFGVLAEQVRSTMLITVFVFLGIEGASVYSRFARKRSDVGRATILGFTSVLALFVLITLFSYGVLPREDAAQLRQPSMAGVMEAVVGQWGSVFVSVGLLISVLGAYLAWTLMSSEVLYSSAKGGDAPRFLAKVNARGVSSNALVFTSALIQVFLVVTLFSDDAFTFMLELCSSLSIIPYLLTAGYALKLAFGRDRHGGASVKREGTAIAVIAVVYTVFLVFAAGPQFLLLSFIIYAPATILYALARREQGARVFSRPELVLCVLVTVGAIVGIVALATGWIRI
jgi:arginine:ornithine antiporter/lysine permease